MAQLNFGKSKYPPAKLQVDQIISWNGKTITIRGSYRIGTKMEYTLHGKNGFYKEADLLAQNTDLI